MHQTMGFWNFYFNFKIKVPTQWIYFYDQDIHNLVMLAHRDLGSTSDNRDLCQNPVEDHLMSMISLGIVLNFSLFRLSWLKLFSSVSVPNQRTLYTP